LGIVFVTSSSGEIRVKKCVPGGPADVSQSIRQGDVLLKIDGFNCTGLPLKDIQPRVSPRNTFATALQFRITRGQVVGAADSKCALVFSRDGKQALTQSLLPP
jgi:C-terminal processing protease CtpA/Prc